MIGIGLIEGFFGPEWSWAARQQFCANLPQYGGAYYFYAPKRDPYLRKNWEHSHPPEMWAELLALRGQCRQVGIEFGVGLSPFEIHAHWGAAAKDKLKKKIETLGELELDYLGLFFDDMKGMEGLAEIQIEIVSFLESLTQTKLIFCPTYYSDDPILDKVFGARPERYLEKIGQGISKNVEILWTGSKVISKLITAEELTTVAGVLRRKPVIWDNFFANDGPKQCKFLRLKPFSGRDRKALAASAGWALNLMNQPSLSEILFFYSAKVLKDGQEPEAAYRQAIRELVPAATAPLIDGYQKEFSELGLDAIEPQLKQQILAQLSTDRFAQEIKGWLRGDYIVGPECLTD